VGFFNLAGRTPDNNVTAFDAGVTFIEYHCAFQAAAKICPHSAGGRSDSPIATSSAAGNLSDLLEAFVSHPGNRDVLKFGHSFRQAFVKYLIIYVKGNIKAHKNFAKSWGKRQSVVSL